MCGIVGYTGKLQCLHLILSSLERLEYRGYDSAGIALVEGGKIIIRKKKGKIANLIASLSDLTVNSKTGIGHTRWATHGEPSDINAHPHTDCNNKIAIVHNGIIDNFLEIKKEISKNHRIVSDTDTEIIAHLIEEEFSGDLLAAVTKTIKRLEGSYAMASVSSVEPEKLILCRKGSPLIIGDLNGDGYLAASDAPSVIPFTKKITVLEDGDTAEVTKDRITIYNSNGNTVERNRIILPWDAQRAQKGGYKHFMQKEIFEQPHVLSDTLRGTLSIWNELNIKKPDRIIIIACGTSLHAGQIGKYWIESISKIPTEVEFASELRYKDIPLTKNTLAVAISQSGETTDTLESVRLLKLKGKEEKIDIKILGIVNVLGSTLTREAESVILTHAGPEIGVAATKTFSAQLMTLLLFALKLAGESRNSEIIRLLQKIPEIAHKTIEQTDRITQDLASEIKTFQNALYLGRWVGYPIALEGALKLKEISYIHAEGYAAGEMKHGPIALVEPNMFSLFIAPRDRVYSKILSNMQEIKARKGKIISVTTEGKEDDAKIMSWRNIEIPKLENDLLYPFITIIPLQLLAYWTACEKGCDVDQPRNLAKSVTVE